MILSASRRTDLPALYGEWLQNRLAAGMALVPDPYRAGRATRLLFSPETVDWVVYWTKNPIPFLPRLEAIEALGYRDYSFQYTITALGDLEPGLPPLEQRLAAFHRLGERLGPRRVDWRFDPILLDAERTPAWYAARFEALCRELAGATQRCILSFADPYAHLGRRVRPASQAAMEEVGARLAPIARRYGLPLFTCAEEVDLTPWGIRPGACVDRERIQALLGCALEVKKDGGQRPACGCVQSVDLGAYNTCVNGCAYCYATRSPATARRNFACHHPESPLLTGWPDPGLVVRDKSLPSWKDSQTSLFQPSPPEKYRV